MRTFKHVSEVTTTEVPVASKGNTVARTPDILDMLLKMSPREAKAFMEEIKKGKQSKDRVDSAYAESKPSFTMNFVC